jgi:bifunctional DNA-binding transcriptional regulator/antitoxin component of YhaV-PrlF toxin-antitoxin module
MPQIRMREKHQVTLPASVVRAANLKPDDKLQVDYVNGSIIITPQRSAEGGADILAFAGIGRGLWGDTAEKVEQALRERKDSWQR